MTFKQTIYSVIVAAIVIGVSLFALQNFQDVNVSVPFVGTFHTKLFLVIVLSFFFGFLTASFISLLIKLFSLPSNIRRKKVENRPVPKELSNSKEKEISKGAVRQGDGES